MVDENLRWCLEHNSGWDGNRAFASDLTSGVVGTTLRLWKVLRTTGLRILSSGDRLSVERTS